MPQLWNNGIVERWNSGFSKEIIHFKLYPQYEFWHLSNIAVSKPQFSNIPSFHHSNWGEAPNLDPNRLKKSGFGQKVHIQTGPRCFLPASGRMV